MSGISWRMTTLALVALLGSACIGLVSVVWGQNFELATQKTRVDSLTAQISEFRESVEKKLDKLDVRLDEHLNGKR